MRTQSSLLAFILALFVSYSFAEDPGNLRFAKILGDNIVIQQGKPITVWGWAKPGTQFEVTITQDIARGK
jgi:hypothetical protein